MYTIRLVFNRKMVHFTSGSYFGPCEKKFSVCITIFIGILINSEHRELYSNMGMRIEYTIFLMIRLTIVGPCEKTFSPFFRSLKKSKAR